MKIRVSVADAGEDMSFTETNGAHKELEIHSLVGNKKVYVCPRGKSEHMGRPWICGKACSEAQPESGPRYMDEEFVKTVVERKETVFDREACLEGRAEVSTEK